MFTRRPYQTEALQATRAAYDAGQTRVLVELATGGGKTSGFATQLGEFFPELFKRSGDDGGLVFFVHRREIVRSTAEAFRRAYPEMWVAVEMGDEHAVGDEDIIVVSVDSLGRFLSNRIARYQHRRFGIVIFDEAHHMTVDGVWDNVATFMGVGSDPVHRFTLRSGVRPLSVLLTATPDRHDGQAISPFLDPVRVDPETHEEIFEPVCKFDYKYLVKEGWLVDIKAYHLTATGAESEIDVVLRAVRDYGRGHKTLVFAPSVQASAEIAATLNARGICSAVHVDANTDPEERARAVEGFREGRIGLLTNFGVFTEGVDLPDTDLIIDAQPTESRVLFAQKVGRGSRPSRDANVDAHETAEARRAAIAGSKKPHLTYISTFDPTRHALSVFSVLTGDDRPVRQDGALVIGEIADRLDFFENTRPAVPARDIRSLDDIELTLREANVWTRTVYNERLHALSPLAWTAIGDTLALYIPSNPWATRDIDRMPCVVSFAPTREDGRITGWTKTTTLSGGWNAKLRRPVKQRELHREGVASVQRAVAQVDSAVETKRPLDYKRLIRRPHEPATPEQVTYLTNAQIKYEKKGLTAATADLLINEHRCRRITGTKP